MNDLYQRATDVWGQPAQIDKTIEELNELGAELARYQNGQSDTAELAGEIADAEIMIEQLRVIFDASQIDAARAAKVERLKKRVSAAEEKRGDAPVTDGGEEIEYRPHSSADFDDMDYVDERGIRIFDAEWACPNCGDDGEMMFRPGSKNTCATCFWVLNGQYNDYVMDDWSLLYRAGRRLLAERGDDWHGTPGSVATRLRHHFDEPHEAIRAYQELVRDV